MNIGIVTYNGLPELTESEKLLLPIYKENGINAIPLIWNDDKIDWLTYECLIFRSVWDSHIYPKEFIAWLDYLEKNKVKTLNPVSTIRYNHHKFYLRDLHEKGVQIIPTIFLSKTTALDLNPVKEAGWKKAVIKPAISATSYLTTLFDIADIEQIQNDYKEIALERDLLVQEFMPEIQEIGEISLIFFNRIFSHAVIKTAKKDDFRVQEEYGGLTQTFVPSLKVVETAQQILTLFDGVLLYARVDGVMRNDQFILMEVELIEPELFLGYADNARTQLVKSSIELMALV